MSVKRTGLQTAALGMGKDWRVEGRATDKGRRDGKQGQAKAEKLRHDAKADRVQGKRQEENQAGCRHIRRNISQTARPKEKHDQGGREKGLYSETNRRSALAKGREKAKREKTDNRTGNR